MRRLCLLGWGGTRLTELYGAAAVERNVPAQEGPESQAPVVLSVSDHLIAALEDNPESDMVDLLTMTPLKDPVVMCTGYVVDRSTFFVDGRMRFVRCPFTREPLSEAGTTLFARFCNILSLACPAVVPL